MGEFEYEKLRVFGLALDANDEIWKLLKKQKRYGSLERQIQRAAESIVLNIAEGAGEFSNPDKARFYRIALRSVSETAAAFDLLARRNPNTQQVATEVKARLRIISAMLTNLIRTTKGRSTAGS